MRHALAVFLVPSLAGAWAFYRQEAHGADDPLQSALCIAFVAGVVAFMGTVLFKALVSRPNCPHCDCRMEPLETIEITERTRMNLESSSCWRVVRCPSCDARYRVPGLSQG